MAEASEKTVMQDFPAKPDLAESIRAWLSRLAFERRAAPKTLQAYARDLRQFTQFLVEHLGEPADRAAFAALAPMDVRAFLAARRRSGIESRSLMRQLAALRGYARHLAQEGYGDAAAFFAVRGPRTAKTLPRPIGAEDARATASTATRAGSPREPWILARDAAVLGLLYGAGLRISEALGIRAGDAPVGDRDSILVTGKGGKQRAVPVIVPVRAAIADYLAQCPYVLNDDEPLFVGARGGALSARVVQLAMAELRGARPARQRHAACSAPFLRDASAGRRRRSARHPGAARPRLAFHHPDLHPHRRLAHHGELQRHASACAAR